MAERTAVALAALELADDYFVPLSVRFDDCSNLRPSYVRLPYRRIVTTGRFQQYFLKNNRIPHLAFQGWNTQFQAFFSHFLEPGDVDDGEHECDLTANCSDWIARVQEVTYIASLLSKLPLMAETLPTREEVNVKVVEALSKRAGTKTLRPQEIHPEQTLKSILQDSLVILEVINDLERVFNARLPDAIIPAKTVHELQEGIWYFLHAYDI